MIGGEVRAVVAVLGVLNRNGIVLAHGCIRDGKGVLLGTVQHDCWNGNRPVGFGHLHVEADRVIFDGRYDLRTPAGRFARQVLKSLGDRARWSLGFHPLRSRTGFRSDYHPDERGLITVYDAIWPAEVSPVLEPAEPSTRTVSLATA